MSKALVLPGLATIVDGSAVPAEPTGRWLADPNTGQHTEPMVSTPPQAVERAIARAAELADGGQWASAPARIRCELLTAFAEELTRRQDEIAVSDSFATGMPLALTQVTAAGLPTAVRGAASQLEASVTEVKLHASGGPVSVLRLPWGPAAVIAPFNAPAFTAAKKAAYALAGGCPVIIKPSDLTPHSAVVIGRAFLAAAARCGAPSGLLQVVHGGADVGQLLAGDPRIRTLAFTGSRAAGASIARAAAGDFKALQLECSSNNPAIVLPDADLDRTAAELAAGVTRMNGQWCEAPGSVFVTGGLLGELFEAVAERLRPLRIGHSADPLTQFGPQANAAQYTRVREDVVSLAASGGTAVTTSELPDLPGYFLAPTLVRGVAAGAVRGDLFGPVLTFHDAGDVASAVRPANQVRCGLAGYVFTRDIERGLGVGSHILAGEVRINGTGIADLCEESVQGFWGGSGIGGHGNADLLQLFWGARIVGAEA